MIGPAKRQRGARLIRWDGVPVHVWQLRTLTQRGRLLVDVSRKGLCERDNLDSSQQLACPTRRLWSQQAPTGSHEDQIPKGCPGPSETLNADRRIAPDIAGQGRGPCDWDNLDSWQQLTCPTRRLWSQQAPTGSHEDQIPERCPGPSETLKADSCIAPEVAGQGWGFVTGTTLTGGSS